MPLYTFSLHLLNVLVRIVNKMGLQGKKKKWKYSVFCEVRAEFSYLVWPIDMKIQLVPHTKYSVFCDVQAEFSYLLATRDMKIQLVAHRNELNLHMYWPQELRYELNFHISV
jgi:hypothetical protein